MAIDTSAAYKAAIKADSETTKLYVEFGFMPDGSVEGSAVTSNDEADISVISQMNDGTREMSAKWMGLDWNRWALNGTMTMIDPSDTDAQVGYWSDSMSGEDGSFSAPKPYLDYTMDAEYDIIGATLFFDDPCEECAASVTIQYYDSSDALLAEETFANDSTIMAIEKTQTGVKRIRAIFNSWCLPKSRVKSCEMLPGEIFVFDPDNTFSFELSESIQPFETAIEFPYFTVKFDNSAKKFDVVNPSGLMAYLRQLMQAFSKIGIMETAVYDYIKTGDFYVYEWPEETQEDMAALTCRPLMAFMGNVYYTAPGTSTQTVETAAGIIFTAAGITNYTIDDTLKSIAVNQYIGDSVPVTNAMGQLAVAAGGYWKFERDGSYSLKAWAVPTASNSTDYDNMWKKPSIEQAKKITSVNVKYYAFEGVDEVFTEYDNVVTAATNDGNRADDICSCFIPTSIRADAVGALALEYFAMRLNYEASYRGDMSIEAGDTVMVENDYADSDVFVLSHIITWDVDNKLSGEITGVGNA